MKLLDIIGGWGLRGRQSDVAVEEVHDDRSVTEYVDWLLQHMLRTSRMELAMDSSSPMPTGEGTSKDPWMRPLPDARTVINRLKVVSGLNPVRFQRTTYGRFERTRGTLVFSYNTCFEDGPEMSKCRIIVAVRVGSSKEMSLRRLDRGMKGVVRTWDAQKP